MDKNSVKGFTDRDIITMVISSTICGPIMAEGTVVDNTSNINKNIDTEVDNPLTLEIKCKVDSF